MPESYASEALLKSVPKTPRGKETLERLLDASEELFSRGSYYATSINDIAVKAGISTGTLYIYFDNKLNLYKYIVLRCGHKIRRYIAANLAEAGPASRYEMEREGLKLYLDYCAENISIAFVIWQSLFVVPDLFIAYYDGFGKQYEKQLAEAVNTGEVRPMDLEVASYVLMGSANFLAMKYVRFGPPSGLPEGRVYDIVDNFMMILREGMFTGK